MSGKPRVIIEVTPESDIKVMPDTPMEVMMVDRRNVDPEKDGYTPAILDGTPAQVTISAMDAMDKDEFNLAFDWQTTVEVMDDDKAAA